MKIRMTEKDLSRIVRRVINEDVPIKCTEKELSLIMDILKNNDDLTFIFNEIQSGIVTVNSNAAKLNCGCKKEELMKYFK